MAAEEHTNAHPCPTELIPTNWRHQLSFQSIGLQGSRRGSGNVLSVGVHSRDAAEETAELLDATKICMQENVKKQAAGRNKLYVQEVQERQAWKAIQAAREARGSLSGLSTKAGSRGAKKGRCFSALLALLGGTRATQREVRLGVCREVCARPPIM